MNSNQDTWSRAVLRATVVAGTSILTGFAFYQWQVFTPTMKAFQFAMSGVSAGIAYAALKNQTPRDGLAALFVWYIILTGLIGEFNSWIPILNFVYVAGIASAIFLYEYILRKPFVHRAIQRVVIAGGLVSITNGVIVIVLLLFAPKVALAHQGVAVDAIYSNLKLGALIGLAVGIGIEFADYLMAKLDNDGMDLADFKHAA
jgi:hypothetical protein